MRFPSRRTLFIGFAALLVVAGCAGGGKAGADPALEKLEVVTRQGVRTFQVEIADTEEERAQGLMNREELAAKTGMLFIYETPRPASFWMKNTLIPLDMVFMDAQGTIRHIHPSAVPLDLTPVPGNLPGDPDPNRLMVLEIGGGEAARLGLREGMGMAFAGLDQSRAAQPCQ